MENTDNRPTETANEGPARVGTVLTEPRDGTRPPPERLAVTEDSPARRRWVRVLVWASGLTAVLIGLAIPFSYWGYRFTHSMTNDAFVETRIVQLAPQTAGLLVSVNVEENDRVSAGQVLAEIDPTPRQRELDLARSKVAVAEENLRYAQATLERLEQEYPRKVAASEQDLAVAKAVWKEAQTRLEVTRVRTDKAVKEAEANVDAAKAVLIKAKDDNDRYQKLFEEKSVPQIKAEEAARSYGTAKAEHTATLARLDTARAELGQTRIAEREVEANSQTVQKANQTLELTKLIRLQIDEAKVQVRTRTAEVAEAKRAADTALTQLQYCRIIAPFDGVVVKRYRSPGDNAPVGSPVVSIYNPKLIYVTANMEEDRLEGIAPGNQAILWIDRFPRRFTGKVVWVGEATGANFALVPRDVSTGEFTHVPQRVPVRIALDPDDRLPRVIPGLAVTVAVSHEPGDADWAAREAAIQRAAGYPGAESGRPAGPGGEEVTPEEPLPLLTPRQKLAAACGFMVSLLYGLHSTLPDLPGPFETVNLGSDRYRFQWVSGASNIGSIAGMAMIPWLRSRFGLLRCYLAGIWLYAVGGLAGIWVRDDMVLAATTLVAAVGNGLMITTVLALMWAEFPGRRDWAIGLYVAALYLGRIIAPSVSGALTNEPSWRSVVAVPAGLAGLVLIVAYESHRAGAVPKEPPPPFDFPGFVLLLVWITCLFIGIEPVPALGVGDVRRDGCRVRYREPRLRRVLRSAVHRRAPAVRPVAAAEPPVRSVGCHQGDMRRHVHHGPLGGHPVHGAGARLPADHSRTGSPPVRYSGCSSPFG